MYALVKSKNVFFVCEVVLLKNQYLWFCFSVLVKWLLTLPAVSTATGFYAEICGVPPGLVNGSNSGLILIELFTANQLTLYCFMFCCNTAMRF